MSRTLLATLIVGALLAAPSRAFSPGPPRPVPSVVTGVCSNDSTVSCGFGNPCSGTGVECVADPAGLVPGVSVRGTLTLIVDEDVSGWSGGPDTSSGRNANARLTVLLEFTNNGTPFLIADTFQLGSTASADLGGGLQSSCDVNNTFPSNLSALCVPGWTEPVNEDNLTSSSQQLNIQWADVSDFRAAIVKALLSATQQTQFPHALPLLEIVDPGDTSDHHGSDPLASIKRFKVTIVVAKGS